MNITKPELLANMLEIELKQKAIVISDYDHKYADFLLLEYIGDPEITEAYHKLHKGYRLNNEEPETAAL